jgi:hypothetical protein
VWDKTSCLRKYKYVSLGKRKGFLGEQRRSKKFCYKICEELNGQSFGIFFISMKLSQRVTGWQIYSWSLPWK